MERRRRDVGEGRDFREREVGVEKVPPTCVLSPRPDATSGPLLPLTPRRLDRRSGVLGQTLP